MAQDTQVDERVAAALADRMVFLMENKVIIVSETERLIELWAMADALGVNDLVREKVKRNLRVHDLQG